MTDPMTIEAARLALNMIRTDDPLENHRAFVAGLRSFDEPVDRLALPFNAMRMLSMQIREFSRATGSLEDLLDHVELTLLELVVEEP